MTLLPRLKATGAVGRLINLAWLADLRREIHRALALAPELLRGMILDVPLEVFAFLIICQLRPIICGSFVGLTKSPNSIGHLSCHLAAVRVTSRVRDLCTNAREPGSSPGSPSHLLDRCAMRSTSDVYGHLPSRA